MLRFYRVPALVRFIYPKAIWEIKTAKKELFLTFDDGPHATSTQVILDLLKAYNAKATWFCLGQNLKGEQSMGKHIIEQGHLLGNHSFLHRSGWNMTTTDYLTNIDLCQKELNKIHEPSFIFRPPYGKMKYGQYKLLTQYKIYMWSHISWDFDPNLNVKKSISKMKSAKAGSILLLHDQPNSINITIAILKEVLNHFTNKGYQFNVLPI